MKKLKNTFKFSAVISILLALSSCSNLYITKDYSGSQCYQIVDEYLQSQGWERTAESEKIVFIKGQSIQLTFDYDNQVAGQGINEGLEVQIHLDKKEDDAFEVSVGNLGMIGEIHAMENRFKRISSKLDEKIKEKC